MAGATQRVDGRLPRRARRGIHAHDHLRRRLQPLVQRQHHAGTALRRLHQGRHEGAQRALGRVDPALLAHRCPSRSSARTAAPLPDGVDSSCIGFCRPISASWPSAVNQKPPWARSSKRASSCRPGSSRMPGGPGRIRSPTARPALRAARRGRRGRRESARRRPSSSRTARRRASTRAAGTRVCARRAPTTRARTGGATRATRPAANIAFQAVRRLSSVPGRTRFARCARRTARAASTRPSASPRARRVRPPLQPAASRVPDSRHGPRNSAPGRSRSAVPAAPTARA